MKRKITLILLILSVLITFHSNAKEHQNSQLLKRLRLVDAEAYQLAIEDQNNNSEKYLTTLSQFEKEKVELLKGIQNNSAETVKRASELLAILDEGLLANPLLDFDKIILLRRDLGEKARTALSGSLGMAPANHNNNASIGHPEKGWKNEISVLSDLKNTRKLKTLYKPNRGNIINDLSLNFNGDELMYSSIGTNNRWHLFSLNTGSGKTEQITPTDITNFDCFDGCYLPDGRITFCSTATFLGLPCINGRPRMSGLYQIEPQTKNIRQITFDQDSNWEPVVMNDGKVLYQRWEYSGLPHSNSRLLFTMNPDGTSQLAHYGSNSYFPTAFFGARPIPGHSSAVAGIATGHHSVSRAGRLLIIDPTKGRHEADGVVAEIPHRGRKVEPIIRDRLPDGVWPLFMNPFPLSEKYFLVSMKESPDALWGLYLVDVFNNMTLLYEAEGEAVIEALPFASRKTPPVIPDRIDLKSKTATVFLQDVYYGPGLAGVEKGEVEKLRIGSYFFSPYGQGGLLGTIGMDGPWDVMRILGTVPVEKDGSAMFTIPANTAVFIQPLDKEGKALQQMRSWFTGMPGEKVSCIGCHENRNEVALPKMSIAARKKPAEIEEWYGPARGFSFRHEVQPVLDKYCVACHNENREKLPYLKGDKMLNDWDTQIAGKADPSYGGHFSESYAQLHRYVRRPGIESDMHMLQPMDVHADQTELIQLLKKGHHNVQLDQESLEKLYCWIDFNAPYHGQRSEIPNYHEDADKSVVCMIENAKKYANLELEFDNLPEPGPKPEPVSPEKYAPIANIDKGPKSWPIETKNVHDIQIRLAEYRKEIQLNNGISLKMIKIPAGEFLMGGTKNRDEQPQSTVDINKAFWVGQFEITNDQFALFNSTHTSGDEHRHGYQFGRAGYPLSNPTQPVVRVSWEEAMEFC
ncbi:MAG: SUMF1/EgtB/PvdO family nonheme iron enzyme, partial [Bacteroidetes bacterium]|nr:SUMF1/EgtB/PvdO family nonheme iron enzyme [Bacteroidota bacterium]